MIFLGKKMLNIDLQNWIAFFVGHPAVSISVLYTFLLFILLDSENKQFIKFHYVNLQIYFLLLLEQEQLGVFVIFIQVSVRGFLVF